MYVNRAFLPQVTNREDLLLTVSLFDDDTGQPIDLDGVTTATGQAFTAAAWTVTDGAIVTTSATQFTIPAFPISGQLSALALTVGAGLAIKAGDPVTIKDTATGRNFVTGYVTSYASATGALVCQIGVTFQFEIRRGGPRNTGGGYIAFYDFGTPDDLGPLLSAALGTGITILDIGVIQILIPETTFKTLTDNVSQTANIGTFDVGMTMTDSVNTRQLFIAELPVLYGGVTN
jgi:hypothetical protein